MIMTPVKTRGHGSVFDLESPVGGDTKNESSVRRGGLIAIKFKLNIYFFFHADFLGKLPQIKKNKSAFLFCEDQR